MRSAVGGDWQAGPAGRGSPAFGVNPWTDGHAGIVSVAWVGPVNTGCTGPPIEADHSIAARHEALYWSDLDPFEPGAFYEKWFCEGNVSPNFVTGLEVGLDAVDFDDDCPSSGSGALGGPAENPMVCHVDRFSHLTVLNGQNYETLLGDETGHFAIFCDYFQP